MGVKLIAKKEKKELYMIAINRIKFHYKGNDGLASKDLVSASNQIINRDETTYKNAFIVLIGLSIKYSEVLGKIKAGSFDQNKFQSKNFWFSANDKPNDNDIDYYVFFAFRYLIELYPDIVYDMQLIQGVSPLQYKKFIESL